MGNKFDKEQFRKLIKQKYPKFYFELEDKYKKLEELKRKMHRNNLEYEQLLEDIEMLELGLMYQMNKDDKQKRFKSS